MNPFMFVYTEFLWRPLFNGLIWLYTVLPAQDIGLAIIVLTIVIRLLLTPLLWKGQKAQTALSRLTPEMNRIKEEHKNDRDAQARATMELYQKHKVNPFSGCLVLIVQLPILIALFSVFRNGLEPEQLSYLYTFVASPSVVNPVSFGIINLAEGNLTLGVFAAVTQYFQTKMTLPAKDPNEKLDPKKKNDFASMFQKQALYIFPILILIWSRTFPSALILYWTMINILGIVQAVVMKRLERQSKPGMAVSGGE